MGLESGKKIMEKNKRYLVALFEVECKKKQQQAEDLVGTPAKKL